MTAEQQKLVDFHTAFDMLVNTTPQLIDTNVATLRVALIEEELTELDEAIENKDLVEVADALGDLLYVVYGAATAFGIDMEPVFNEIHRSNMTKLWPDGRVYKRPDGKVLKPDSYSPAMIARELSRQLRKASDDTQQ